jgi:hypothetical protein
MPPPRSHCQKQKNMFASVLRPTRNAWALADVDPAVVHLCRGLFAGVFFVGFVDARVADVRGRARGPS